MHRKRVLTGISMAFIIVMSFLFLPLNILTPVVSIVVSLSAWEFLRLRFTSEISVLISLILFFCLIYLSFGIGFKLTIISSGLLFFLGGIVPLSIKDSISFKSKVSCSNKALANNSSLSLFSPRISYAFL